MKRTNNFVPANIEEFYTHYVMGSDSLVNQILRQMLPYGTPEEREDLASGVVLRAMEHKSIEKYDAGKANFGGVVFFLTRSVVTHHLSRKSHDPVTGLNGGSLTSTDGEDFELGAFSLERMFGTDEFERSVVAKSTLDKLVDFAKRAAAKASNKRDRSLLPLMNLMAQGYEPKEIAGQLGVTQSTVGNWVAYLRMAA